MPMVDKAKMSVFAQHFNPITGKLDWDIQQEDYDFKQEIARSAYADMLHDHERNNKYYKSLKQAVEYLHENDEEVHVLDIGAGTGLLSMMAMSCNVNSVTACEAFKPMAECARKILHQNRCGKIKLINKRSTELTIGPGQDMERKANLLITEVFDTELIGEGAIQTFRHAKQFLLTEHALVIPSEATVYAQVVSSSMLLRWNRIYPVLREDKKNQPVIRIPLSVQACPGLGTVHDIQLSQVPQEWFTKMSEPLPVFTFDWTQKNGLLKFRAATSTKFRAMKSGECAAVLVWWEMKMDQKGEIVLSCAPYWAHPDVLDTGDLGATDEIPWRDHWLQAVYFLPKVSRADEDLELTLLSYHDEYNMWFRVESDLREITEERPSCECGMHLVCSRTRLGQMNDPRRVGLYLRILKRTINENSVCLMLGETCLYCIIAAKLGAKHVYVTEKNEIARNALQQFIIANKVQDVITVLATDLSETNGLHVVSLINVIFAEPFFSTSLLPWHSLFYWYLLNSARHLFSTDVKILPSAITIWGLPVEYKDLWKIRYPLYQCCGFQMDIFDKMIGAACEETDDKVEPQPLWEYPCYALADPIPLVTLQLGESLPDGDVVHEGSSPLLGKGIFNGMALWADWHFSERSEDILSTGPTGTVQIGQQVEWDVYTRQGVQLMQEHVTVSPLDVQMLNYSVTFHPHDGTFNFGFEIKQSIADNSKPN